MKKTKKILKAEIVFHLIKKMSQSDKRLFKLNNQTYNKKGKDFLKLFDYLNTQKNFDSVALEKFFEKNNITNTRACINYLHDKVINSLQRDARKSLNNKIKSYNESIEKTIEICNVYLYADLPEHALAEIRKAEKIALKLEDYHYLVRLYQLNIDVINIAYFNHDTYKKSFTEIKDKLNQALKQLLVINDISKYTTEIQYSTDADSVEYQKLFSKLETDATRMHELPFTCKQDILRAKVHHAYLKREPLVMLDLLEQMVASWETIPYERWNLGKYMEHWGNLLIISIESNISRPAKDKYFKNYLELPKKHPFIFDEPIQASHRIYAIIKYAVKTLIIIKYEEYNSIYTLDKEIRQDLNDTSYLPTMTNGIHLIFLRIALVHLILKNYDDTDYWINRSEILLSDIPSHTWQNTFEILSVMRHYDKGNHTYLKSKIRNLKRTWQKEKNNSPNILVMLKLIQKALLKSNQDKISEIWEAGLPKIQEAEKSRHIHFIKLSKWIKAKINK